MCCDKPLIGQTNCSILLLNKMLQTHIVFGLGIVLLIVKINTNYKSAVLLISLAADRRAKRNKKFKPEHCLRSD